MNILVLCTGNSARSILLEAILNRHGAGRISAWSAGSQPVGRVHPMSLQLLDARGYDTSGLRSKSWDVFAATSAPVLDLVITVCGNADSETCPIWHGAPLRVHWGVDDPAALPADEQAAGFRAAYDLLANRAKAFLALEFEDMTPENLLGALNDIGRLT